MMEKRLCTCLDIPNELLSQRVVSIVKQFVGDDPIRGERKYKDAVTFFPETVLVFATNHPLKVPNVTEQQAFLNRMVVLPFDNPIPEDKQIPQLFEHLLDEIPYIVGQAIQAVKNLADRNFVLTEVVPATNAVYCLQEAARNEDAFAVARFIRECCTFSDYNALALIFQTAVDNQLCSSNPVAKSIRLPKYETVTEKHAYTQEQYDLMYAMAKEWEGGLSIMLLLETGISRSELLGLRWEDLDFDNKLIHINQGLVFYHSDDQDKWISASDGLKNKYRKRSIPILDSELLKRLQELPREIIVNRKAVKTEYVFHSPAGKPYQPNNWVNRVYKPFMEQVQVEYPGIPLLSVHELRHTRATLWTAQGIDPYMVARLLGHSDLKMLTRIYDHTSPETLRKALEKAVLPKDTQ